jgi:hypothetical protein
VSARRRITSKRRLARNQIVDGAAKIIGEGRGPESRIRDPAASIAATLRLSRL